MRVYLLSTYEEHGSYDMVGTADPSKLEAVMVAKFSDWKLNEEFAALKEAISSNELGKHNLSRGWGGIQLHIIDLE